MFRPLELSDYYVYVIGLLNDDSWLWNDCLLTKIDT